VRAVADDQALGQLVQHLPQVVDDQPMPVLTPPVGDHAIREHDDIAPPLGAVDGEAAEAVVLEAGHRNLPVGSKANYAHRETGAEIRRRQGGPFV
jgi:hypothetical protein